MSWNVLAHLNDAASDTMKQKNNVAVTEAKYFIKYNTKCLTFLNNKMNAKYSLIAG